MISWKWITAAGLCLSLSACSSSTSSTSVESTDTEESTTEEVADAAALNGTYSIHVDGFDWGAAVTKALVTLDKAVDSVSASDFSVTETKQYTDFADETFPVEVGTFDREVTDAYLCDEEGNKVEEASKYVMLELSADPNTGSPLLFTMSTQYNTWSDPYTLDIKLAEGSTLSAEGETIESLNIEETFTSKSTSADSFSIDTFTAEDGVVYDYALFTPEEPSDKLVVWLHGMGEGGVLVNEDLTDPYVILLANEAANLADSSFQEVVGNANILVPQSPTYWMDNTGDGGNFDGGIAADGTSYYTESLHELIDAVKAETGSEKVVITGASNGGYMTMLLAITYGDEYDGYLAIAEPYTDELIDDDALNRLKDVPLYLIFADNDTTVDPTVNELPTIERLKAAGANLQVAEFEDVHDTSGLYNDEEGNPYQYAGHWSWIYFFNNEAVSEDGVNSWQWIADILNS